MSRRGMAIALGTGIVICLAVLFYFKVGGLQFGHQEIDRQQTGYCFDVATDRAGDRLFVAAGDRGMHLFDLDRGELQYVTTYYDDGYYRNLKAGLDRVYVADSRRGLVVLEIGGKTPTTTWVQSGGTARGLHLEGDLAFVAAFEKGLRVLDISDPDSPVLLASLVTPGYAWDIWVHDGVAYVADFNEGLTIVDVSSPLEPCYITTVTWVQHYQSAEIVRGEGSIVYVAAADHGLVIVDASDPRNPVVAARYKPSRIGAVEGLAVRDGLVYLTMGSQIELKLPEGDLELATTIENGLHILDTTDPYYPQLLGRAGFLGWVEGVHVAGHYAYVANTGTGVRSINIRDPRRPLLVDAWYGPP